MSDPYGDVEAEVDHRLSTLVERPVDEHAEVFDDVSRLLRDALARLDEG